MHSIVKPVKQVQPVSMPDIVVLPNGDIRIQKVFAAVQQAKGDLIMARQRARDEKRRFDDIRADIAAKIADGTVTLV